MKTALITGASQGLGRALMQELTRRGLRVVGVARGMRDAPAANQCTKEEREDEGQQDRADEDQAAG